MHLSFFRRLAAFCRFALLGAFVCMPAIADDSLYQQLGGQPGVSNIVERFVALVTTDDRTKADFDNINLDRLKGRLKDHICQITGGPCVYKGRSMAAAHAGLDLSQAKFNATAEDMQTAMQQAGVPYWTQNRLMAMLAPMQREIVTK